MKINRLLFAFFAMVFVVPLLSFSQDFSSAPETKALLSKLQSMGHGYHSAAEWNDLFAQLHGLENRAQADRDWDTVVEVNVIKAMVYSDMLNDQPRALAILQETLRSYRDQAVPSLRKVYVREAEVYAKLGDEAAIGQLIKEYKASSLYDPQTYAYSGGQGRDVPLAVVRPNDRGDNSLSVTAMETYRVQARSAAGMAFPEFRGVDQNGREVSLSGLRGKVVLVDFWMPTWEPWKRELSNLVGLYRSYGPRGLEIVGMNLVPSETGTADFLRAYSMSWPQISPDPALMKKLGIFGEATSYLIDQNGLIVGRDLKGSELTAAVKRTLGLP